MKLKEFDQGIKKKVEFFRLGLIDNFKKESVAMLEMVASLDSIQDSITGHKVSLKKFEHLTLWDSTGAEKSIVYNSFKNEVDEHSKVLDKHANDFLFKFTSFVERLKND